MTVDHADHALLSEKALTLTIAARIREHLDQGGGTLEKLADFTGVEQKILRQIAKGERSPSIHLLWKIANALGVPFGSLLGAPAPAGATIIRKEKASVLSSCNGGFKSRALTSFGSHPLVEIYELTIAVGHTERSQAHAPGTTENIHVTKGALEITSGREPPYRLAEGDAVHFDADVPHSYANVGDTEAVAHLVLAYENFRGA